jgi:hypothetical protein
MWVRIPPPPPILKERRYMKNMIGKILFWFLRKQLEMWNNEKGL